MKRRSFVQGAAAAAALSLTPSFGLSRLFATGHEGATLLRFPPDYDGATIAVGLGQSTIWGDVTTETYRFGGYPGVTIRKNTGDIHTLVTKNMLATPLAVHWHGLDVPSIMDGHPMDAIAPGESKEYSFEVKNRAGTYFYHSHSHERVGREVNRGLVGLFIVSDAEEQALQLPSGNRDVLLLVQDIRIGDRTTLLFGPAPVDVAEGWLGNTILVNGTPNAFHVVEPAWHRVRIVNGSNARIYDFKFSNAASFFVIGGDGGLLSKPESVQSVKLGPGERADVLVDFSRYASGSSITLLSGAFTAPVGHRGSSLYPQGVPYDILRFDIVGSPDSSFTMPSTLASIPALPSLDGIPIRRFELAMSGHQGKHTINTRSFEMDRTDFEVQSGKTEIWEFANTETNKMHPIHVHGRLFRVLSKTSGDLAPHETGYKDTVMVGPFETVRVLMNHGDYEGTFLVHCHNLEHEDDGMMLNFKISKATSVTAEVETGFQVLYDRTADMLRITAPDHVGVPLAITDLQGSVVLTSVVSATEISFDVRGLVSGSYILSIGKHSRTFLLVR